MSLADLGKLEPVERGVLTVLRNRYRYSLLRYDIETVFERLISLREEIARLRDGIEDLEMHALRDIAPGWVSVMEVEWDQTFRERFKQEEEPSQPPRGETVRGKIKNGTMCAGCGMHVQDDGKPLAYHPHLACLAFTASQNGGTVEANLKAVIEYGMRAERCGLSASEALADIGLVGEKSLG